MDGATIRRALSRLLPSDHTVEVVARDHIERLLNYDPELRLCIPNTVFVINTNDSYADEAPGHWVVLYIATRWYWLDSFGREPGYYGIKGLNEHRLHYSLFALQSNGSNICSLYAIILTVLLARENGALERVYSRFSRFDTIFNDCYIISMWRRLNKR